LCERKIEREKNDLNHDKLNKFSSSFFLLRKKQHLNFEYFHITKERKEKFQRA